MAIMMLLTIVPMTTVAGTDWHMIGGSPGQTSTTAFTFGQVPNHLVWEIDALSYEEMMMADDGTLYVTLMNGSLLSISPHGSVNWCLMFNGTVMGSPLIRDDGTIVFITQIHETDGNGAWSYDGWIYSVKPDGSILAQTQILDMARCSSPIEAPSGDVYFCYTSEVRNSSYESVEKICWCLNYDLGLKWSYVEKFELNDMINELPCLPSVGIDSSITFFLNGTLVHLSDSGEVEWKLELEPDNPYEWKYSSLSKYPLLIGPDDRIYFGHDDYGICLWPNGTEAWQCHFVSHPIWPVALGNGLIYFADKDGILIASWEGHCIGECEIMVGESGFDRFGPFKPVLTADGVMIYAFEQNVYFHNMTSGMMPSIECEDPIKEGSDEWGVLKVLAAGNNSVCYQTSGYKAEGKIWTGKIVMMDFQPLDDVMTIPSERPTVDIGLLFVIVTILGSAIFIIGYAFPDKRKK